MQIISNFDRQLRLYSADPKALRDFYVRMFNLVDLNFFLDSEERRNGAMQLSRYGDENDKADMLILPKRVTRPDPPAQSTPIFFVSERRIQSLWKKLQSHGVPVTPIQTDRSGLRFFEFVDPDENRLEICEQR